MQNHVLGAVCAMVCAVDMSLVVPRGDQTPTVATHGDDDEQR